MPNTRKSKPKSPFHYAVKGEIRAWQDPDRDGVGVEVHHCTAYLSREELLEFLFCQLKAGKRQWGDEFMKDVQTGMEVL